MQAPHTPSKTSPAAAATPASPAPAHTTPMVFWNAIRTHSSFVMWQPAAKILFQMALESDPDGAQRFADLESAVTRGSGIAADATSAFHKTQAGKLYRALSLQHKIYFN